MEKTQEPADYFDTLGDEMGVNDIASLLLEPWALAQFQAGGISHKLSPFKVVKVYKDDNGEISGCTIKISKVVPSQRAYKNDRKYNGDYGEEMFVDRQQLIDMLTQGWQPALQSGQGAGDLPL